MPAKLYRLQPSAGESSDFHTANVTGVAPRRDGSDFAAFDEEFLAVGVGPIERLHNARAGSIEKGSRRRFEIGGGLLASGPGNLFPEINAVHADGNINA